ncbi:MAG: virulence RhuM family protein [Chlorobi bacterium]|nr:virulence RhuM family protein [Chlorobiota bacterium]
MKNEIVIYQPDEISVRIDVRIEDETVWLNRHQIALLFGRDVKTIGKHINNVFSEGELIKEMVVAKFATTTQHGAIKGKYQTKLVEYYNLDVIISVGYRVKSKQGTQFRIWANKILKDYLLKGYAVNNRINRIEDKVERLAEKVNEIDLQLKTDLPPNQGVFFDGQIFDAYAFVNDLLRSAEKNVILIDNYIDDTVLTLFGKYPDLNFKIITRKISKQLQLDINKYNEQYGNLETEISKKFHDRFLIIDKQTYHIGASLKDLGKKIFAFGKLDLNILERY